MTDFLPRAPLPTEDAGGGTALPANVPAQMLAVQTQYGGQLEVRRAARQMPRDLTKVKQTIDQLAELVDPTDDKGGDTWEYRFPVKNNRTGKTDWIEGPTIKCSNAIARSWGNCSLMASRTDDIGSAWVFYATFIDFETGFEMTRAFQQRKGQQSVKGDSGRSEDLAFQIGQSKALRNVITNALGDIVAYALRAKDSRWKEKIKANPDKYRDRIKARLAEIEYPLPKVEGWVGGGGGVANWTVESIGQVMKILSAHAEGALEDLDAVFAPRGPDMDGEAAPATAAKPNGGTAVAGAETVDPNTGEVTEAKPARKPRVPKPDKAIMILGRPFKSHGTAVNEIVRVVEKEPIGVLVEHEDAIRAHIDEYEAMGFDMKPVRRTLEARYEAETDSDDEGEENSQPGLAGQQDAGESEPAGERRSEYDIWLDGMRERFSKAFPEALLRMVGSAKDEAARFGDEERAEAYAAIDAAAQARRKAIADENRARVAAEADDANKLG